MKKLLTAALLAFSTAVMAQQAGNTISQLGCGTPPPSAAQMQEIYDFVASNPAAYKTTAGVDTVPVTLQIVGMADGTGYYKFDHLFTAICELNAKYAPVNMYFAIKWPIKFIKNNDFYDHDYAGGALMMQLNNVPGTINLYFVEDPNGNCGYYSPALDAVAIAKSCGQPGNTTIAHELGHFFSLPHTFYGWEGGNPPANPEKVTRGAGANCSSAGDGFCDTDADYLFGRWQCPFTGTKLDPDGVPIDPDETLYMSYAEDACTNRFSNQQVARMQNNRAGRTSLSLNGVPTYSELSVPHLFYPTHTELFANHKKAIWGAVNGAQYYYVKVWPNVSPGIILQEAVTASTEIDFTFNFAQLGDYTIQITPLNARNVCRTKSWTQSFTYNGNNGTLAVSSLPAGNSSIRVSPNPARGTAVNLQLNDVPAGKYTVQAFSFNGQKVYEQSVTSTGAAQSIQLPAREWTPGIYAIRCSGAAGQWTEKVVIQ